MTTNTSIKTTMQLAEHLQHRLSLNCSIELTPSILRLTFQKSLDLTEFVLGDMEETSDYDFIRALAHSLNLDRIDLISLEEGTVESIDRIRPRRAVLRSRFNHGPRPTGEDYFQGSDPVAIAA
jgi:hypothetical protein